jgi:hypothetical protein
LADPAEGTDKKKKKKKRKVRSSCESYETWKLIANYVPSTICLVVGCYWNCRGWRLYGCGHICDQRKIEGKIEVW